VRTAAWSQPGRSLVALARPAGRLAMGGARLLVEDRPDPMVAGPNEGDPNEGDPNEGGPNEGGPNEGGPNGGRRPELQSCRK
jgi:hypothetical protein